MGGRDLGGVCVTTAIVFCCCFLISHQRNRRHGSHKGPTLLLDYSLSTVYMYMYGLPPCMYDNILSGFITIGNSSWRAYSLRQTLKRISHALIELSDVCEFQPSYTVSSVLYRQV